MFHRKSETYSSTRQHPLQQQQYLQQSSSFNHYNNNNNNNNNNNSCGTNNKSNNNSNQRIAGPRTKCDQVIFEALAKASEIIVRSRCHIPVESTDGETNLSTKNNNNKSKNNKVGGGGSSSSSSNGSSSRFNIEVPEVEEVR